MSYSFSVRGANVAAALAAAAVEFQKVVDQQPIHAHDADAARKVREEVAAALPGDVPEGQDVYLSCGGSVSWQGTYPGDHKIVGVSVNCYACYQDIW
jgi:hypothetical protein